MKIRLIPTLLLGITLSSLAQEKNVPASYSNIGIDKDSKLYFEKGSERFIAEETKPFYTFEKLFGNPKGTVDGVALDFGDFEGSITYGLIPYGKAPHPLPVFRFDKKLIDGKAIIDIKSDFRYPYDFVDWQGKGQLTMGYRLIDKNGTLIFDGVFSLTGKGPFEVASAIYEGPFVNKVEPTSATIWYNTTLPVSTELHLNGKVYKTEGAEHHEITVTGLQPGTSYPYKVIYGDFSQEYSFKTAPELGSRQPFVFAYTSDSRHATGGGERFIYGANAYIMKKMAALAYSKDAKFVQFTGDMIDGYLNNMEETQVQYTNWKKAVEPFWHYIPFYVGMGNHEALGYIFRDSLGASMGFVDKFPFETQSSEAAFSKAFVNPEGTLKSEDNSKYDPSKGTIDFPSYTENVYYYTYDNVAMIVLNSDYWYAPSLSREPATSGGLHGYIMDNQLQWLESTVLELENDARIDHIFVTQHTPVFPNGGHSKDDMWYSGNNEMRPVINGKPVDKGIIERRNEYLDVLINKSKKVLAVLTGDEHNYNRLKLTNKVPIYPEGFPNTKLNVSRPIFQINNGASGAPYYAQEILPWSDFTEAFSVENAVCFFYIDGKSVKMEVINPDTLNVIDKIVLR